jgi:glycogen debranching enzyme
MAQIDDPRRNTQWTQLADRVSQSIRDLFYRKTDGYLADCLHAAPGTGAKKADRDDALRPNQLFAITLGAISDPDIMEKTVHQCGSLIVPGAIRSLADRPVKRPLEIMHNGRMLNDPNYPYQGIYTGDEDTRRKPAYHNGTAWTWVFPSFCEAWPMVFGDHAKDTARAILASSAEILNTGCAGQVPEILDGNYPHPQRGCDAQAWGASEWLRVWIHLSR